MQADTDATADRAGSDPLLRGAPTGSLRYYAVLFAPLAKRRLLNACYSLDADLRDSAASINHDIAHTRLQWWRGELDRYVAGRATHPLTVALSVPEAPPASALAPWLHELVVAADLDLARFTYGTWQELAAYCYRSGGALQRVISSVLAAPSPATPSELEFASGLGAVVRQTEMLRDRRRDRRRGLMYVPLEALADAHLEPAAWLLDSLPAPAARLREQWLDRVSESCAQTAERLGEAERSRQRHGLVLLALHARLLSELRARGDTEIVVDVPPLSRLWIAWRTAVGASAGFGTTTGTRP
jgi:phytoene synthase